MNWHFSPVEVVTNSAGYGLADFRRDLMRQAERQASCR